MEPVQGKKHLLTLMPYKPEENYNDPTLCQSQMEVVLNLALITALYLCDQISYFFFLIWHLT